MPALGAGLAPIEPGLDYHSFANVDQFRTTHIALDLRVDLEDQVISGVVTLELKRLDPRATQLVLDTKGLTINDVNQKATDVLGATDKNQTIWVSRPFHLEKPDPILGSALVIELPPSRKPVESIRIDYETLPSAGALQWLTPKQTAGAQEGLSLYPVRAHRRAHLDPAAGHAAGACPLRRHGPYRRPTCWRS